LPFLFDVIPFSDVVPCEPKLGRQVIKEHDSVFKNFQSLLETPEGIIEMLKIFKNASAFELNTAACMYIVVCLFVFFLFYFIIFIFAQVQFHSGLK